MTEFYTVRHIDNSRLRRPASAHRLKDCARRAGWGVLLALFSLAYAWQHFQCIQLRYQIETLDAERERAAGLNQQLRIEAATLSSPGRIDDMAKQLGLTVPVPGQISPVEGPAGAEMAQARNTVLPVRP
ncbi:MAG: hypothetical protein ACRD50_00575 [Candidatus Acidiferrales bacterium]